VIGGTRLRGGNAASARGAASMAAQAIGTARACGCTGTIVVRLDSAFYAAGVIAAIGRNGAFFSVTARMDAKVAAAIAAIGEDAWTAIRYPRAIWDDQLRCWVSDAEIAEIPYTAFASKKGQAVTARLIVRQVRDLNKKAAEGQGELFPVWRYHPVFSDSPFQLAPAEEQHRDHAVAEQVFADWTDGPLAHLPSGSFCRERRVAAGRRDSAQPPPRRRRPGQPAVREGPGRDHPPRPGRRRRPHRPARPRPPHLAPARGLAPRTRMAEPARGLRPARRCGLTSPEPVTTPPNGPPRPSVPRPRPEGPPTGRRPGARPGRHARTHLVKLLVPRYGRK
jgi:hypothetical protein